MIGVIAALLGTLYSSYTDIKTGYVNDNLAHAMILLGAILVPIFWPQKMLLIYGVALAVFLAGFGLYLFGQMGGGDMKLFTALALLIPFYPAELVPFAGSLGISPVNSGYPFILSVFVFSGILFMFFMPAIFLRKIYRARRKIDGFGRKLRMGAIYSCILVPLFIFWSYFSYALVLLFLPMIAVMFLYPFKDDIVKHFFAERKRIADLNDDDVIALECLDERTKRVLGLWRKTFTSRELGRIKARAKKAKMTYITVCENMPKYVPYIFASLVLNLIFGDVLLWVMMATIPV
jgi:Flp pilus assembly protein protease CpaA